jgi:dethiobiotin synthetase
MRLKVFITGTDTGVGKTYVAASLLHAFTKQGFSTLGIKPLASGCHVIDGKLYSEDALALQTASSIQLPYEYVNPVALQPAIAPHIAAAQIKINLSSALLQEKCLYAFSYPADVCIVEGVGGWHTPLNTTETMADFVTAMQLPVILVVGIRLGCLNHALLTYQAIKQSNVTLLGWIANCFDPAMEVIDANINALREWLSVPCLGVIEINSSS